MLLNKIFYILKPVIPRRLQVAIRRQLAAYKRKKYTHIWPIDPNAGGPPEGWKGWPDGKKFAFVLTHDVDTKAGHDRCRQLMDLEEELGFRSSFNFVPERYKVSAQLIKDLKSRGFEVGIHGLKHDGKLYASKEIFDKRAEIINKYIREWNADGFRSPAMHHNLDWIHSLDIKYDASTFDTDPFEPQSDGTGTIFPFWISNEKDGNGYVELPYTLVQDFTLFILLREKSTGIWKRKLDWIVSNKGMALMNTHPDYMHFGCGAKANEEYSSDLYLQFLMHIKACYENIYYHVLPNEVARFWESERAGETI